MMSTNAFNLQLAVEGEPSCASAAPSTSLSRFAQELHRLHIPKHTFPQDDGDSATALDHFFNADDAADKYYNLDSSSSRQTPGKFAPASLLRRETSMTTLCHSTDSDVIIPGCSSSQTFSPSSRFSFSNSTNFPKSEPLPCRRQTQTQSASSPHTVNNSVETPIIEQREADDADDTFDDSVDEICGPGEQPPSSGRWRLWNGVGGRRNSSTASFSSKNITANNLKTPTFSSKNITANNLKTPTFSSTFSTFSRSNISRLCHSQPSSPVGVRAHEALHPTVFNSGPLLMPFGRDGESPFVVPRSFLEFGQDVVVDESPTSAAARTSRNRRGNYGMFRTAGLSSRSPRTSFDVHAESSWRKCEEGHAVVAPREVEVSEDQQPSAKDVSAGRFFDALKGPELETPKESEDLLLPMDEEWPFLLRVPIGVFRITLGLGCQSVMWKDIHTMPCMSFLHIPAWIHVAIWWLAVCTLLTLLAIYAAKCIVYFEAVRREFHHPVRVNYFFTPWISAMFLAQGVPAAAATPGSLVGPALWVILMVPIVALELKLYGQWLSGGERRLSKIANPSTHLSVVGNFVGAKLAQIVGLSEIAILFWAIGLAHYLVLFVTLYQRLPTNVVLPKELHPVYFLFVAIPSNASVSWKYIIGSFGSVSKIFFFLSLFLYVLLGVRFNFFRGTRFSIAWWAYTFPMSAAAIASIHYAEAVPSNITRGLAVSLALIASITVVGLSCVTLLHAFVWRSLFPNDIAIAITATKHHGKIQITKRRSDLSDQSIQTQSSENSNRLLDFTICVKPDLVFEKSLPPNLGKLFTISPVNNQSSSALDMCER